MALRFYMDVHIPAAITEGLRRRGVNVLTSQEDSTREATDETLLRRALELDRIPFSQDTDFLRLVHEWQSQQKPFAGIVFAHQQGLSIGQCIADLQLLAECCQPDGYAPSFRTQSCERFQQRQAALPCLRQPLATSVM